MDNLRLRLPPRCAAPPSAAPPPAEDPKLILTLVLVLAADHADAALLFTLLSILS